MPTKIKDNYAGESTVSNPRDNFQTPRYATELLIPFIPDYVKYIWEPANGDGAISRVLKEYGFSVQTSDIRDGSDTVFNFLDVVSCHRVADIIITNPPFSSKLKIGFYNRCMEYGIPFALLIPADYSGWLIKAMDTGGCEKIIPSRRIDYITPFIEELVFKGETLELVNKERDTNFKKYKDIPHDILRIYSLLTPRYDSVLDIPEHLIKKYSSSNFHSMWLTWGFNLGKSETFAPLSNANKIRIL